MQVTTNTEYVEQRAKWGRRIAPLTMLFLIGGLITNFMSIYYPDLFRPTMILLALGFVSAIISSNLVNNWVREPRADQVLSQILKKFSNEYVLLNYTASIPHVLIAPDGVYAFLVKNNDGEITVNGRKVSRKFSLRRAFGLFGSDALGSPINEVEARVSKLQRQLAAHLSEEEMPPVKPIIIFSHKNAQLSVIDPAIPTMQTNQIKSFLRNEGKNRLISAGQRGQLAEILGAE
jgi:hypothetical protein